MILNYDRNSYEVTSLSGSNILVKTKTSFKNSHDVELIVGGAAVLGENPKFDLFINENLVAASETVYKGRNSVFSYIVYNSTNSITSQNTN